MQRHFSTLLASIALLATAAPSAEAQAPASALTAHDLIVMHRVSDPQVAPDGHSAVYVQTETDLEADKRRNQLWLVDLSHPGAAPVHLLPTAANDSSPRWGRDAATLFFLSTRSGSSQVWRTNPAGGEPVQVTHFPLDVDTMKVSPDGTALALTMQVRPQCNALECTKQLIDAQNSSKAKGRVYDRLFVRHWDTWSDGTRSHLFVVPLGTDGTAGAPTDLLKTLDGDVPSKPFGGDEEYAFSPDGKRLVFSIRIAGRSEPWSTNFDLYESPIDGATPPKNLTASNPAWDTQPVFLRNGDLAWLAQARPKFESDRFHIMIRSAATGATREVAKEWDHSVAHLQSSRDGRTLLATADQLGQHPLFSIDPGTGAVRTLVPTGEVGDFSPASDSIVLMLDSLGAPADLYAVSFRGKTPAQRLTDANRDLLAARTMGSSEQFRFSGANGDPVYGYVVKPPGFKAGARFPIAFLVHGGPQVSMQNSWSYRWNAQTFAARGYGVVMIDFHGSPGYGQKFTDSISHDWGGKPLTDLQLGLAAATAKFAWLDGEHACALGASYGGFMINWIAGNWPDRFKCLVNHDGIFDQRMMYYSTEELWFPEWEHGAPYYEDPQAHERFNPANFVARWQTPTLVIHGEQDFRIPYDQGLATFTALQRRGIESRLMIFPNENHWVLKPADSAQWYDTVLGWLDAHLKL